MTKVPLQKNRQDSNISLWIDQHEQRMHTLRLDLLLLKKVAAAIIAILRIFMMMISQ